MMIMELKMHPLGDFINKQIQKRGVSNGQFARDVGVDESTISLWMSKNPPKAPSYKLLTGLARETKTDICAIIGLVAPDLTRTNANVIIAAGKIADLTPDQLSRLNTFLLALDLEQRE